MSDDLVRIDIGNVFTRNDDGTWSFEGGDLVPAVADLLLDRIEALEARNRALEEELRRLHDVVCDEDARSIREALDA